MSKPPRRLLPGTVIVSDDVWLGTENVNDVVRALREEADKARDERTSQDIKIDDLMQENQRLKQARTGERGITTQSAAFTRLAHVYRELGLDTALLRKALMKVYGNLAYPDRAADRILKVPKATKKT